jgi:hypothetical protein
VSWFIMVEDIGEEGRFFEMSAMESVNDAADDDEEVRVRKEPVIMFDEDRWGVWMNRSDCGV